MARHPRRAAHEDGDPKFWLLFFLGLVIVLVLFRAFVAAVEGMGGFGTRKRRRERSEDVGIGRRDPKRRAVADCHLD